MALPLCASWDLPRQPRDFQHIMYESWHIKDHLQWEENCAKCATSEGAVVHSHHGEFPSFPSRFANVCLLRLNLSGFSYVRLHMARRDPLD